MKQVRLTEWYGRLGNNLTQLINAIAFAKQHNYVFVYKDTKFQDPNPIPGLHDGLGIMEGPDRGKHMLITPFLVNFSERSEISLDTVDTIFPEVITGEFYDDKSLEHVSNAEKNHILKTYVYPHFQQSHQSSITESTLVIHIRSGDIFNPGCHSFYVQPPFAFYKKIIDEHSFDRIHIITEPDKRNPCIQMIQDMYPTTTIQSSELINDCSVILQAKHFACNSTGTFGHMLALLSKNIEHLYLPKYADADFMGQKDNGFLTAKNTQIFFDMSSITEFKVHEYAIYNYIPPFSWSPGNPMHLHLLRMLPTENVLRIS
jgi:hypothetical protein